MTLHLNNKAEEGFIEAKNKLDKLDQILLTYISKHDLLVLAYSGGIDSSLVAQRLDFLNRTHPARETFPSIILVSFQHEFLAQRDLDLAVANCQTFDLDHRIMTGSFLADYELLSNSPDRCYLCKFKIFSKLIDLCEDCFQEHSCDQDQETPQRNIPLQSQNNHIGRYDACDSLGKGKTLEQEQGPPKKFIILEGSNYSDLDADRPGRRALRELGIQSPLEEAQLTKTEIRQTAKILGLANWNQPCQSCLATRIPTGQSINQDKLRLIEEGENFIRSLGFSQRIRLRLEEGDYKYLIQLSYDPSEEELFLAKQEEIEDYFAQISDGFASKQVL